MTLEQIRDRYFRKVIAYPGGIITHHADCQIHRAIEVYDHATCTCGLLHDLRYIDSELALKIFPNFFDDDARSEMGKDYGNSFRMAEGVAFLENIPEFAQMSVENDAGKDERQWSEIGVIFGEEGLRSIRDRFEKHQKEGQS